jgi:hypothetical protein
VPRQPAWTLSEWALLVGLVAKFEGAVPERELGRAHVVLRAAALTSEDPTLRRRAAAPSFRSLASIWAQYYLVRRTRKPEERWRDPRHLRETWQQFDRDADAVVSVAQQLRETVSGEGNPYGLTDQAAVRLFLTDLVALLDESVECGMEIRVSNATRRCTCCDTRLLLVPNRARRARLGRRSQSGPKQARAVRRVPACRRLRCVGQVSGLAGCSSFEAAQRAVRA